MRGTVVETRTNSKATFFCRVLHMDTIILADRQGHIHQLCADTGCCVEDTLRAIGTDRERETKESVLPAGLDDEFSLLTQTNYIIHFVIMSHVFEKSLNYHYWECPWDVMVKALDCVIVVREFELQFRYYVHFRTNTFGKGVKVKLVTLAEGDPKAPFSIATAPRCRGEGYFILWIAPLYLWS